MLDEFFDGDGGCALDEKKSNGTGEEAIGFCGRRALGRRRGRSTERSANNNNIRKHNL